MDNCSLINPALTSHSYGILLRKKLLTGVIHSACCSTSLSLLKTCLLFVGLLLFICGMVCTFVSI